MHQFLAKEKWAEQTLSLPGSDTCDPHEECTLVWRRQPCWVGWCVPKPGLVALYTYYIYRLKCTGSDLSMNIYRLMFPQWLIVYYHAYTRSNTILCACKILLDGIGIKEALGAPRRTSGRALLEMWACWNRSMRVPVTDGCHKGFLRPYCLHGPSSWAREILNPFGFLSTPPPKLPQLRGCLPGERCCAESESFVGNSFRVFVAKVDV